MKLTRRQILAAVGATAAIQNAAARPATADSGDFRQQKLDNVQSNDATLAKLAMPIFTEPAFRFQA